MKMPDWIAGVLWLAAAVIIAVFAIEALSVTVGAAADIAVAIITAAAGILLAVVSHYLAQVRAQTLQDTIARDQLDLQDKIAKNQQKFELKKQMQINYAALIEKLDKPITDISDIDFSLLHLQSWVVGSKEVVESTKKLFDAKDTENKQEATKALLFAMRQDMGLEPLPGNSEVGVIKKHTGTVIS